MSTLQEYSPASYTARIETPLGDIVELTYDALDPAEIVRTVQNDSGAAGAICSFIGTTRDNFEGKRVTRLDYQAYTKLALKTISKILASSRNLSASKPTTPPSSSSPNPPSPPSTPPIDAVPTVDPHKILRAAVHHRLGTVPVGEISIVIVVSSPHRRESFETCEWILEEVKKKAQIWKREWYIGEEESEALWKANFPPSKSITTTAEQEQTNAAVATISEHHR